MSELPLQPGRKSSSFAAGVTISLATMLVGLSSDEWRVKLAVIIAITLIAVAYNFNRTRLKRAAIAAELARAEKGLPPSSQHVDHADD